MIQRMRDVKRGLRPQGKVLKDEWDQVISRFNYATRVMEDQSPLLALMQADLEKARQIVLENRVHEVQEIRTITKSLKKIFTTPREEQLNELVGQIKYIQSFLREMKTWIDHKEELERLEGLGVIQIERD